MHCNNESKRPCPGCEYEAGITRSVGLQSALELLKESGLLEEINRVVLHPRGLRLEAERVPDDYGGEPSPGDEFSVALTIKPRAIQVPVHTIRANRRLLNGCAYPVRGSVQMGYGEAFGGAFRDRDALAHRNIEVTVPLGIDGSERVSLGELRRLLQASVSEYVGYARPLHVHVTHGSEGPHGVVRAERNGEHVHVHLGQLSVIVMNGRPALAQFISLGEAGSLSQKERDAHVARTEAAFQQVTGEMRERKISIDTEQFHLAETAAMRMGRAAHDAMQKEVERLGGKLTEFVQDQLELVLPAHAGQANTEELREKMIGEISDFLGTFEHGVVQPDFSRLPTWAEQADAEFVVRTKLEALGVPKELQERAITLEAKRAQLKEITLSALYGRDVSGLFDIGEIPLTHDHVYTDAERAAAHAAFPTESVAGYAAASAELERKILEDKLGPRWRRGAETLGGRLGADFAERLERERPAIDAVLGGAVREMMGMPFTEIILVSTPSEIRGRGTLTNADMLEQLAAIARVHLVNDGETQPKVRVALTHSADGPYGVIERCDGIVSIRVPTLAVIDKKVVQA